jgi:uncharacterized membrane protein
MLFFAAACFLIAIPFVVMGAWPIFGFMGLDVALVYWAFPRQLPRRARL